MPCKKYNTLLLVCLAGFLVSLDIIFHYKKFSRIKAGNLSYLNFKAKKTTIQEIDFKQNHLNSNRNASVYLMNSIKATLLPPSDSYIREPISNLLLLAVPCCSLFLPYKQIANFVTFLSIFTVIPIFFLIKSSQLNHRKLACILFQFKRYYVWRYFDNVNLPLINLIYSLIDCLDGPIARMDASQPLKDNTKLIDNRTIDALGSTIPTIGFLSGYSIYLVGNAFFNSQKSNGFELIKKTRAGSLFLKFTEQFFKSLLKQKDLELKLGIIPSYNDLKQRSKLLDVTVHLIFFLIFLVTSGICWNSVFDYFTNLTIKVSI